MSKHLSGAQKRNIRKRKLEECKSMSQQFGKWLKTENSENRGSVEEVKSSTTSQGDKKTLHLASTPSINDNSPSNKNDPLQEKQSAASQDILLQYPHYNSKEDEPAQSTVSQTDNTEHSAASLGILLQLPHNSSKEDQPVQSTVSQTDITEYSAVSQGISLHLPHNNSKEDEPAQSTVSQTDNTEQNMFCTVPEEILLNYNDPHSWPAVTGKLIHSLVSHGADQGDNINFNTLKVDDSGRKFTKDWFYVKQINGETVKRKWILYSVNQNAVFCFPCMLFGQKSHNLSDPQKGFYDWRHLHPVIPRHENSPEHRISYVKWKVMEKNIKSGNAIDDYVINSINKEKMIWREILKIILDAILFCAKYNLALRGSNEIIGDPNCGIF